MYCSRDEFLSRIASRAWERELHKLRIGDVLKRGRSCLYIIKSTKDDNIDCSHTISSIIIYDNTIAKSDCLSVCMSGCLSIYCICLAGWLSVCLVTANPNEIMSSPSFSQSNFRDRVVSELTFSSIKETISETRFSSKLYNMSFYSHSNHDDDFDNDEDVKGLCLPKLVKEEINCGAPWFCFF